MDTNSKNISPAKRTISGAVTPRLKLDLTQITNHPLVRQNKLNTSNSQSISNNNNECDLESPQLKRQGASLLAAQFEQLARTPTPVKSQPAATSSPSYSRNFTPNKRSSFSVAQSFARQQELQQPAVVEEQLRRSITPIGLRSNSDQLQMSRVKQIYCTPATPEQRKQQPELQQQTNDTNNNNFDQNQLTASETSNNGLLKIRRSTSLSYTSTLRRRRQQSPLMADNLDLPSPKPNVVLPNFSISAYDDSTTARRLSYRE